MARRLRAAPRTRTVRHQVDEHDPAHLACPPWRHRPHGRAAAQPARDLQENAGADAARTGSQRPDRPPGARQRAAHRRLFAHRAWPATGRAHRDDLRLGARQCPGAGCLAAAADVAQAVKSQQLGRV